LKEGREKDTNYCIENVWHSCLGPWCKIRKKTLTRLGCPLKGSKRVRLIKGLSGKPGERRGGVG